MTKEKCKYMIDEIRIPVHPLWSSWAIGQVYNIIPTIERRVLFCCATHNFTITIGLDIDEKMPSKSLIKKWLKYKHSSKDCKL